MRTRDGFGTLETEARQAAAIFIYDGLCGFCNKTVWWLLKRDRGDHLRFAPQQSRLAEEALSRHGIKRDAMLGQNSVYLLLDMNQPRERLLLRSDVLVYALLSLGGFWKVVGRCVQVVPRFVRDAGYTLVARSRYRIAGKYETCPVPTPEEREKFVGITDW
jgi:predicted DCC family thiol-disulfide oxidoreductase YuxK